MGFGRALRVTDVLLLLFLSTPVTAEQEMERAVQVAADASRYVVRIDIEKVDVFQPHLRKGHGSGFIVDITNDKIILVTNRHVVERGQFDALRIRVAFPADHGALPEVIPGRVAHLSKAADFAILECDLDKLSRTRNRIEKATLADGSQPLRQGQDVATYGYPIFDSPKLTTGVVTGYQEMEDGVFIQTEASINEGNSGGPMISLRTGQVVGITNAMIRDASNVGFAIPIIDVLPEYEFWKSHPNTVRMADFEVVFQRWEAGKARVEGLQPLIDKVVPGYFERFPGFLIVGSAPPNSSLQIGDLILTVNGKPIGACEYELRRELSRTPDESLKFQVIRNHKVQTILLPIRSTNMSLARRSVDFIMVSGLLIQDLLPLERWYLLKGGPGVEVVKVLPHSLVPQINLIPPGSIITAVQMNDKMIFINNLFELKTILRAIEQLQITSKQQQFVRFITRPPALLKIDGDIIFKQNPIVDKTAVEEHSAISIVPIDHVITPRELSIRDMREQFDFTGQNPQSHDWHWWLGRKGCHQLLQAVNAGQ